MKERAEPSIFRAARQRLSWKSKIIGGCENWWKSGKYFIGVHRWSWKMYDPYWIFRRKRGRFDRLPPPRLHKFGHIFFFYPRVFFSTSLGNDCELSGASRLCLLENWMRDVNLLLQDCVSRYHKSKHLSHALSFYKCLP